MSAPNACAVSPESVLIAYRWPRTKAASLLPSDILALCPPETRLGLTPCVTRYICRGRVALDVPGDARASDGTAVTFFGITATARQTQGLAARAAEPTGCCGGGAVVVWSPLSDISFSELAAAEGQRRGFITHDPVSPASVTARNNLLKALDDLGLQVEPTAPPMDLVSLCGQHGLDPSRLLAATRIQEFLPLGDAGFPRARMLLGWRAASRRS